MATSEPIKQLRESNEAEDLFPPPSDKEIINRQEQRREITKTKLFSNTEKFIPGLVEKLKIAFNNNEVLVETAIAYADTKLVSKILDLKIPATATKDSKSLLYDVRNLEWHGPWTDGATFIEQTQIIEEYKDFSLLIAKKLVKDFSGKQFQLCRESSVAVYIKPVSENEWMTIRGAHKPGDWSEYERGMDPIGNGIRLWWD